MDQEDSSVIGPDGDRCEGEFLQGQLSGLGVYTDTDGDRPPGQFSPSEQPGFLSRVRNPVWANK
ncbi:MAG: hypothetical protein ACRC8Y_00965 [Chroococcales cyanobacterium]